MSSSQLLLQTLQHLSEAATIVDGDNRTKKLLHCYYMSRIQSLAVAGNNLVEKSSYTSCTKCATSFNDSTNFSLSIRPRKIRKDKYRKFATNLECKSQSNKSKFKRNFGKKYQRLVYNVAEITCLLCLKKQESCIRVDSKDKMNSKSVDRAPPSVVQLSELELVKPKKRKRDKHAGLILPDSRSVNLPTKQPTIQPIIQVKSKVNKSTVSKMSTAGKKTKPISTAQKQRKGILLLANVLKMNDQRRQNDTQFKLNKMFK